jgi:hypothetical protein
MKEPIAVVIPNGFVDSWMVVVQHEDGACRANLVMGLSRLASDAYAKRWNERPLVERLQLIGESEEVKAG